MLVGYDIITVGKMLFVNNEDEIIRTVGSQVLLEMVFLSELLNIENAPCESKWSFKDYLYISSHASISASKLYANKHQKQEYAKKMIKLQARDHRRNPLQ